MTAQGYAPPKHCADAGSPAARSPSNRDRYRRADIHCNTRDRQKPAAETPTPAKGRSACGRTRSLHQKKNCRTGNCREMAEQKTTAASPEKGLAAVVLAPQTGLEPAAFRLGATSFGLCLVVRCASKCPQTRINTGFFIEQPVAEYLKISSNIGPFCTQIEPAIRQILDRF